MTDAREGPANTGRDWVSQPVSFVLWWCVPVAIGLSTHALAIPLVYAALVWSVAFVWMGIGCVLNARRCHRLHCYISGPVFLLGAAITGLIALGAIEPGMRGLSNITNIALLLALSSFAVEAIWGRYRRL
jgi:hypothetical protein